jgi:hypothetical protein
VFAIEDAQIVARQRRCTTCRECLRSPSFANFVRIGKEEGRVEFTVESVGVRTADRLVREAFALLRKRCADVATAVREARQQAGM